MKKHPARSAIAFIVWATLLSIPCADASAGQRAGGTPHGFVNTPGGAAAFEEKQQKRSAAYEWLDVAL